jgi:uncharacterized membrane protein (DUF441 family)
MTFYAKAIVGVIVFWLAATGLWTLQETHPIQAAALLFTACACVVFLEIKKGKR